MFSSIRFSCNVLLLLSALALFSCGSDDPVIENQPVKPEPTPSQPAVNHFLNLSVADSLTIDYTEGSYRISVTTDTTFTVNVNSDWLEIEVPAYGSFIRMFVVYIDNQQVASNTVEKCWRCDWRG